MVLLNFDVLLEPGLDESCSGRVQAGYQLTDEGGMGEAEAVSRLPK